MKNIMRLILACSIFIAGYATGFVARDRMQAEIEGLE